MYAGEVNSAVMRTTVQGTSILDMLPGQVSIRTKLEPKYFEDPKRRLVVAVLLCDDEAVRLIHSAKAPPTSFGMIFPQEKAKIPRDRFFVDTIRRGMKEELGLRGRSFELHERELFRFVNIIPASRNNGVSEVKEIVYFGAQVSPRLRVRPNPAEIREVVRATEEVYLDQAMASGRTHKCAAQNMAMVGAMNVGLLDRSHWEVLGQMSRGSVH